MISLIIGIILIAFLYSISVRISSLESKVKELSKGSIKKVDETKSIIEQRVENSERKETVTPPGGTVLFPNVEVVNKNDAGEIATAQNTAKQNEASTEFAVGSRALTGIGVFALILGVGFFLRYAFDNNLISEGMRIFLGAFLGVAVSLGGHYLRKKYTAYGNTLMGAGLGILYLTTYSAYTFYGLISPVVAFGILLVITAVGVGLALSYDSKHLVAYSFVGAYIIPFLLPMSGDVHLLFVYLSILNIGVLLVARFKIWPEFTLTALGATSVIFLNWVFGPYTEAVYVQTFVYLTVLFLIYFTTSLLNFVYRDRNYKGIDGILIYTVPIAYFLLALTIVKGDDAISLLSLAIGVFYIVLSLSIRASIKDIGELTKFSNALLGIAAPFIALAIIMYYDGRIVTVALAMEAMIVVIIGYILDTRSNRIAGVVLATLAGVKLVFTDLILPANAVAIFNERAVTFLFVLVAYLVIWKIYISHIQNSENEVRNARSIVAFGISAILFIWTTLEVQTFIIHPQNYLPMFWMIVVLVVYSLGLLARESNMRQMAYVILGVAVVTILVTLGHLGQNTMPLFNIRVGTTLLLIAVSSYIVWTYGVHREVFSKNELKLHVPLMMITNITVLWAFSMEILAYFNNQKYLVRNTAEIVTIENTKRVMLSVFWLAYALVGLGVGIFRRSVYIRYASIILFAFTIFKIFLYDTANLSDVYRFISFITLGVILLIAGYAYYRFKGRIMELVGGGVRVDVEK